jgi:hypothetical protein
MHGASETSLLSTERIRWEFARCDRFSRQATLFPLAPNVPVKVSTFADDMGGCLADRRFFLFIVGLFAAVALILAAVGLYGVVACYVALRTQEIGFRIALGARRSDVLRLVLGQGSRMAVLGVVVRIGAALAISRLMSSLLFGISTTAPLTFADVALLVSLIALAASYIPARRAMRVDPVKSVTLRIEHQNFGFETEGRYIAWINPMLGNYKPEQLEPMFRKIDDRLSQIPGVRIRARSQR